MENLDQTQLIILLASVAGVSFIVGRATARGASSEDRAEKQMRALQEAEHLFSSLSPTVQQEVDSFIQSGKPIEAIKIVRQHSGAGLREAKFVVDRRRAAMGST